MHMYSDVIFRALPLNIGGISARNVQRVSKYVTVRMKLLSLLQAWSCFR